MTYHLLTTAYHPQTNGLTERLNKTLADMLAMYVDVDQKNWDNILPFVTFAYNSVKQKTTGFSPFFLVHGRDVDTPLDGILPFLPDESAYDYVQNLMTKAEEARQLEKIHLAKAQDKDKSRYDEKHRTVSYKEGDLVWIFTPIRKVGLSEKLLKRYFGPYRVTKRLSEVTYKVEPCDSMRSKRKLTYVVHVLLMKPYNDPDLQLKNTSRDNSPTQPIADSDQRTFDQVYLRPVTRNRSKQNQRVAVSRKEGEMSRSG
ncbi:hypothetical protein AVEN_143569-1 [Araneus ventricosus]|uniref:Integrase catalytic domain-containing protein n=1 Tax=Araneus ventricosus TaxID=182803 RepID=A0A4Y2AND7_ARAVE|nr:hypothetical protein AVEN_143569-1 [Araneus ventricosus]